MFDEREELRATNARSGARISPEACVPLSRGDRIDLHLTVDGLLERRGPAP